MSAPGPNSTGSRRRSAARHRSRWSERLLVSLVGASAPEELRDAMVGDLREELCQRRRRGEGRLTILLWLARELALSTPINVGVVWRRRRRDLLRGVWRMQLVQELIQDVRTATRGFRRQPLSVAVVVVTVAIGIAATTVVFSVVDGVLFDPYPFPEPSRLVGVGPEYPKLGRPLGFFEVLSPAEIGDIREQSRTLERIVAWDMGNRQIAGGEAPENVLSAFWWGDPLATLGVRAAVGRSFTDEETARSEPLALISHRLWQRLFGGDPKVVGSTIEVNGKPYELIGVLPPKTLIYGSDLWIPMAVGPESFARTRRQFELLARVRAGSDLEAVNVELETIARRIESAYAAEHEEYEGWRLEAQTWNAINVGALRPMALIMVGAVAFTLLLVCANVASLLVGRSTLRVSELTVRKALGAGRLRIVRQVLAESALLALAGGAAGIAVARLGVRALSVAIAELNLPVTLDIELNGRVLLVSTAVTLGAGLLFGLLPALQVSRGRLEATLRSGSGSGGGVSRQRAQRVLVGIEVALALVLLFGSGLLVQSMRRLQEVPLGLDPENVLTLRLTLPWERYEREGIESFFGRLSERLEARPEVESVALASQFPPRLFGRRQFSIEGTASRADGGLPDAYFSAVSPGFFGTLAIPLLQGRTFVDGDVQGAPVVALVNQTGAQRFFPDGSALGRRIRLGELSIEIVGVIADTRNVGPDRLPEPEFFGSLNQLFAGNQLFVLVRSGVEAGVLADVVRERVRELDPNQPIYAVQTMSAAFAGRSAGRRIVTRTLLALGIVSLLLAGCGVFAVVSAAVSQRRAEIGLRIALGAATGQLRRWVLRRSLWPVLIGAAVGVAGSIALGQALGSLLFEVGGLDPMALAAAVGLLLLVATGATWLPAWRASRVDPVETLREE